MERYFLVSRLTLNSRYSCLGYCVRFIKASYEAYECYVHGIDSEKKYDFDILPAREDEPASCK